jgi:hypothetical protein
LQHSLGAVANEHRLTERLSVKHVKAKIVLHKSDPLSMPLQIARLADVSSTEPARIPRGSTSSPRLPVKPSQGPQPAQHQMFGCCTVCARTVVSGPVASYLVKAL